MSMNIYGPTDASLTIHCDSWRYVSDPSSLAANERMGGSCYQLDIFAHDSTSLTINSYQGEQEMYKNTIVTPNNGANGGYSTNIECGLTTSNSPTDSSLLDYQCGRSVKLYSVEGWNDVNWYYASGKSSSLVIDTSQQMRCGQSLANYNGVFSNIAYDYICTKFAVNGRYGCNSDSECDSYTLPTEEPSLSPTAPTTAQPTLSPTIPTTAAPSTVTSPPVVATTPSPTTTREYVLVSVSRGTWLAAEAYCQSEYETHLATIITSDDLSNVLDLMDDSGIMDAWIGLNDRSSEGYWSWSDGSECFLDSNSCSQFWSSSPSDTDEWGNSGADCAMLRDDSGGILYEMQCDTISDRYADAYLCNAPVTVSESSDSCKAVYFNEIPTFPLDICLGSDIDGVSMSSIITCNEFGEAVALKWNDRSDCVGTPDDEDNFAVGDGVECEGNVCEYAVVRIYNSSSCTESGSFGEYPVNVDNCYMYDESVYVQYECDAESKTLSWMQYTDQWCGGSPAGEEIVYKDGACDDRGRYYSVTCDFAVAVSIRVAVFISFIAMIFETN